MYDYLKIVLSPECKEELLNCPLLDFKRQYSEKTGELNYYSIANNNSLQWIIYDSGTILLKGSFHKFHNQGLHNYNDYTLIDFIQDLRLIDRDLCKKQNFTKIYTLEIGVNVIPPLPTKKILNNLLLHKGKKFQDIHIKGGDYRQCVHSQYILKCYDKSKQFNLPYELMRWEVKITKMEQLRKLGIYSLINLTKPYIIKKLGEILIQRFEEVIMYDPSVNNKEIQEKDKTKLKDWNNPNYWTELIENTPRTNKNKINREINKFRRFIETNSENTQHFIKQLISDKWGQLTNFSEEAIIHELGKIDSSYIHAVFPNYINKTTGITVAKKGSITTGLNFDQSNEIRQTGHIKKENLSNDLNKNYKDKIGRIRGLKKECLNPEVNNTAHNKKRCLVTGLDISMQKENSKFLCTSGIRYYYENEPNIYYQLEKRLSDKWKNSDLNVRFCEVAHSIRNEFFNTKYRIENLLINQNGLFDNRDFIRCDLLKKYEI